MPHAVPTSFDADEIAKFSAMAADWWNPTGKFAPLHALNPVRLSYIKTQVCTVFGRNDKVMTPFEGLSVLDIGCGGGLLCEPMARLGATVMGADASAENIQTAQSHAGAQGLDIDYRHISAESLAQRGAQFDILLNMEVVEHVADVPHFLGTCAHLLRPDGLMVVATLNRTLKSFALAIVGAEYILHWVPRGTHDFDRFVRPAELSAMLRHAGLKAGQPVGMHYTPVADRWTLSDDIAVNYMLSARPNRA